MVHLVAIPSVYVKFFLCKILFFKTGTTCGEFQPNNKGQYFPGQMTYSENNLEDIGLCETEFYSHLAKAWENREVFSPNQMTRVATTFYREGELEMHLQI